MTNEGNETVKLVDANTKELVHVPGGIRRLAASPDWSNATGTWRYVGPVDDEGYPASGAERWLAEHRYQERVEAYEERFERFTGEAGYREAQEHAEREGIELSEAINALIGEYPRRPQPGVRGGGAQRITDALIRERAQAFELSERDAVNSLMLDGYEL